VKTRVLPFWEPAAEATLGYLLFIAIESDTQVTSRLDVQVSKVMSQKLE
jgi:hypothetical protein